MNNGSYKDKNNQPTENFKGMNKTEELSEERKYKDTNNEDDVKYLKDDNQSRTNSLKGQNE